MRPAAFLALALAGAALASCADNLAADDNTLTVAPINRDAIFGQAAGPTVATIGAPCSP